MLHGGDLFHEASISDFTRTTAYRILKKHVFGHRQHRFEVEGIDDANFKTGDHNIKMPIFIIHGNHDEPIGIESVSVLE